MLRRCLVATLCLLVAGCTSIAYYAQAVEGQMKLMAGTRPISEVVGDAATDPKLRQQLERVTAIREFASSELALPDNGSYRSYADLGRPYAIWNVFAAPEFSVEPQQWCMLFAGCVNYRGYYGQKNAELYAGKLKQEGMDTYVSGVLAYSTLGHFNDPVLNTFLRFGDEEIARIIFHELAHQLIYADGDSAFNESFATTVENEGIRRWLAQSASPERLRDFETQQDHRAHFEQLVADTRDKLRAIYASSLAPDAKRRAKTEVFAEMKQSYTELKAGWGGHGDYDRWFSQPLNNAMLASVTLYTQWVPAFQILLELEGGILPRFYQRVAALARLPKAQRSAALDKLRASRAAPSGATSPRVAQQGVRSQQHLN
ncbi:MAG TPA: aminopeptidase [Gallionella sp.]|nr:aminopeptidase [Gallionella sp.]